MLAFLEGKVAKWWLPDEVLFVHVAAPHRNGQAPETPAPRRVRPRFDAKDRRGVVITPKQTSVF